MLQQQPNLSGLDNITAKGDLIVGTEPDKFIVKSVGTDGTVLSAKSTESGGVEWKEIFNGLSKITVGTSQPLTPSTGDLWCDTN